MRKHKKDRGHKSQAVGTVTLRPRSERHGKLLSEVYWREEVVRVTRGVRVNAATGVAEMYSERKVLSPRRPMTPNEIEEARARVLRALHSTATYGRPNGKE